MIEIIDDMIAAIGTIDDMIAAGDIQFISEKEPNNHKARKYGQHKHVYQDALERLKTDVREAYQLEEGNMSLDGLLAFAFDTDNDEESFNEPDDYSEFVGGISELENEDYSFMDDITF